MNSCDSFSAQTFPASPDPPDPPDLDIASKPEPLFVPHPLHKWLCQFKPLEWELLTDAQLPVAQELAEACVYVTDALPCTMAEGKVAVYASLTHALQEYGRKLKLSVCALSVQWLQCSNNNGNSNDMDQYMQAQWNREDARIQHYLQVTKDVQERLQYWTHQVALDKEPTVPCNPPFDGVSGADQTTCNGATPTTIRKEFHEEEGPRDPRFHSMNVDCSATDMPLKGGLLRGTVGSLKRSLSVPISEPSWGEGGKPSRMD